MGNGYFMLVSEPVGFGLKIIAPKDGGEKVRIGEVTNYLSQNKLNCDPSVLKSAIEQNQDTVVHLGNIACPAVRMTYNLTVEEGGMSATVRLYPASQSAEKMSVQEFIKELEIKQIRYGINEERIREAFSNQEYCTDIVVAEGKAVRQGKDAKIEYFFNTDVKAKPTVKEDGSVDFFNLNTINSCHAGDMLARLTPADLGDSGISVQGTTIKPKIVKNALLKYGNNVIMSEDKRVLTAKVDGHVTLVDEKVFVSNVLQLENVDISTGNIEYEGSVTVTGNVQSNFSVKAKGNIVVNGLVEGAFLEAEGDIIIARGMAGMSKGELKAGGNIVAKFLESTKATAGGYIAAESILHSTAIAGGDINVDGRRGFISGGRACATRMISAKTIGSPMGTSTIVEVGADPVVKSNLAQAQKQAAEISKEIKKLDPVITSFVNKRKQGVEISKKQLQYLASIMQAREQKLMEYKKVSKELGILQEMIEMQTNAQVIVKDEIYPGAKIVIEDVSMAVQRSMQYCKFVKLHGDVKMVGL